MSINILRLVLLNDTHGSTFLNETTLKYYNITISHWPHTIIICTYTVAEDTHHT